MIKFWVEFEIMLEKLRKNRESFRRKISDKVFRKNWKEILRKIYWEFK